MEIELQLKFLLDFREDLLSELYQLRRKKKELTELLETVNKALDDAGIVKYHRYTKQMGVESFMLRFNREQFLKDQSVSAL